MAEGSPGPGSEGVRSSTASKFDRRSFMKIGAASLAVGAATVLAPEIAAAQTRPTAVPTRVPEKITPVAAPKKPDASPTAPPATATRTAAQKEEDFEKERKGVGDAWNKRGTATAVRQATVTTQQNERRVADTTKAAVAAKRVDEKQGGSPLPTLLGLAGVATAVGAALGHFSERVRRGRVIGLPYEAVTGIWRGLFSRERRAAAPADAGTAEASDSEGEESIIPFIGESEETAAPTPAVAIPRPAAPRRAPVAPTVPARPPEARTAARPAAPATTLSDEPPFTDEDYHRDREEGESPVDVPTNPGDGAPSPSDDDYRGGSE